MWRSGSVADQAGLSRSLNTVAGDTSRGIVRSIDAIVQRDPPGGQDENLPGDAAGRAQAIQEAERAGSPAP